METGPQREPDKQQSRRSFLRGAAYTLGAAAISSLPASVSESKSSDANEHAPATQDAFEQRSEKLKVFLRSREPNFDNIGVFHDEKLLEAQLKESFLGVAIPNADVILLEKGEPRFYFGQLKQIAENMGKQVFIIDPGISNATLVAQIAAQTWASFRALRVVNEKMLGGAFSMEEKTHLQRDYVDYLLKTLGIAQLGFTPPSQLLSTLITGNMGAQTLRSYPDKYDIGLKGDARTVFMAIEILKKRQEFSGKKIISVTGDAHATGIDYYLFKELDPETGQPEYLRLKNAIYSIIYGLLKEMPF